MTLLTTSKAPKTTGSSGPRIGDEAVAAATGKTWPQWFTLLDKSGAKDKNHKQIVELVSQKHGIGPWWRQMVAVNYEQARGLRKPHEKPGGFSITVSRTIAAPVAAVDKAWADAKTRARWLGVRDSKLIIRKATPGKSLRITWVDGKTNLDVGLLARGESKTQVAIEHARLGDAAQARTMKAYWAKQLDKLKSVLEE